MSDCKSINSVNPLYFLVSKANGHIEEKNGNKFIKIKTKKYLKKTQDFGMQLKMWSNKPNEYGNKFVKIKFNSDNNLPLNIPLKLHNLTVVVSSVFEEDGKYYP